MMIVKYQKINLSNNSNTTLKDNLIGVFTDNIFIQNDPSFDKINIDWSIRESSKFDELLENRLIIKNAIQKNIILNEKMDKVIKYSNLYRYSPECRLYGCFTAFSSIQKKSDKSDLAQLELYEKNNIISFVKNGFAVKAIVSLDINMIFSNNAYTKEQYLERCSDLYQTIKSLEKYKNFQVVFDEGNTLDSMYIIDTLLLVKSYNALFDDSIKNYSTTVFESDMNTLEIAIRTFEKKFNELKCENKIIKKFYYTNTTLELFDSLYKNRMSNWFVNRKLQ